MENSLQPVERNIDFISKVLSLVSRIIAILGGFIVIFYSLTIDHFPRDLSLGDGILFYLVATCFGGIYLIFNISLLYVGILLSPIWRIIINAFHRTLIWAGKMEKKEQYHPYAPFEFKSIIFSLYSIPMAFILMKKDKDILYLLSFIPILHYIMYSIYISCGNKIKDIELKIGLNSTQENDSDLLKKVADLKNWRLLCIGVFLGAPIILAQVFPVVLNISMQVVHIRLEHPIIYLKMPYSALLPKNLISTNRVSPKDYTAFDGAKVLFTGFGKVSVIEFVDKNIVKNLEIPNDQIIIESH